MNYEVKLIENNGPSDKPKVRELFQYHHDAERRYIELVLESDKTTMRHTVVMSRKMPNGNFRFVKSGGNLADCTISFDFSK